MPLPEPRQDETKDAFLSRCVSHDVVQEDFATQDQRLAVCADIYDRRQNQALPQMTDPSGTSGIRNAYARETRHLWNVFLKTMRTSLIDNQALRFNQEVRPTMQIGREGQSPEQANRALTDYMAGLITTIFLQRDDQGKLWNDGFLERAYNRGVVNVNMTLRGFGMPIPEQAIQEMIRTPFHQSTLQNIKQRNFEEFATVRDDLTDDLAPRLKAKLIEGFEEAKTVQQVSRDLMGEINNRVENLAKYRGEMIARTEIVRANGIARQKTFEAQGIQQVLWIINVGACRICEGHAANNPWQLTELMDVYPAHPNEKCSFGPYQPGLPDPNRGIANPL